MSVSFPNPLPAKEEQQYIQLWNAGDMAARDILIEHNLRLVAHIAKKYTGNSTSPDDLISIGTIGLIKAVNTYNSEKAAKLATYASRCIENEILMHLRSTKKSRSEISLSDPIGTDKEGNEINLNDIIGTEPDAICDDISLKIQISKMLKSIDLKLSPREKFIIINRYGISSDEPKTQREIASSLKISRSYVSRIEKGALNKLKAALKNERTMDP